MEEHGKPRITAEEVAALVRERDPEGKTIAVVVRTTKGSATAAARRKGRENRPFSFRAAITARNSYLAAVRAQGFSKKSRLMRSRDGLCHVADPGTRLREARRMLAHLSRLTELRRTFAEAVRVRRRFSRSHRNNRKCKRSDSEQAADFPPHAPLP